MWRGTSADDRAATRRARLLEIGFELLGEKGAKGITVREVYARARLNPRYFYESFSDLDALLVAVFDGLLGELISLAVEAIEAADSSEAAKTRAAVEAAFRYLTDDRRRVRILLTDALGNEALAARRRDAIRIGAEQMALQASAFYGIAPDARLLRSTTYMLAGGLVELLIAWDNGTLELTVEELIDDGAELVSGFGGAARELALRRANCSHAKPAPRA
jgi:AcrR family transcriptional regulator